MLGVTREIQRAGQVAELAEGRHLMAVNYGCATAKSYRINGVNGRVISDRFLLSAVGVDGTSEIGLNKLFTLILVQFGLRFIFSIY